jgi:hypothetical protein
MRMIDLAVALTIYLACVAALLMMLLVWYGLGVPPAALRINALISAGAIGFVVVVAIAGGADESEE